MGPIVDAKGQAANQGGLYAAEDIVNGCFTFASGVQGTGLWCFTAFKDLERNLIVGTKGEISYSAFANEPIRITTAAGEQEILIDHPPHVQQPLIEAVVGELLGYGKCPSTGASGARANWIMEKLTGLSKSTKSFF